MPQVSINNPVFSAVRAALRLARFVPRRRKAALFRHADGSNAPSRRPSGAVPPRPGSTNRSVVHDLVHDTVYRRIRRRALARLHNLDDRLFQAVSPRRQVLFDAVSPMSFAVFRPIFERLRRDPRIEIWFTAHGNVWQPQDIYGPFGIVQNVVPAARARWMKVDLYVNADFWDMTWLQRRTRRVHLFHGVAGKYGLDAPVDLAPTIAAFDCLMFANADRRRRYLDAALAPDDPIRAALVGYPKVDCLVDGSLDRHAIALSLELDPRLPTVIYAPTWSPYSSLNGAGEEVIERLAATGLQVIVKLHDRSYDRRKRGSGGIDWASRLARFDSHPLVRVAHGGDSCPLLAASDVLISDHSSIAFEYMLLDRPVILLDRPDLIRKAGINPEKVALLRSAADVVTDPAAVGAAVSAALARPAKLSPQRQSARAQLFYRPGTATDRAVALIYSLIDLPVGADTLQLKPEPRGRMDASGLLSATG